MEHEAGPGEPPEVVRRRDNPAPAPWVHEVTTEEALASYVGKPQPARAISMGRLVAVALLAIWLIGMVLNFVFTAMSVEAPATMALGMVYGAVIQLVGWWTVIHLIRHR